MGVISHGIYRPFLGEEDAMPISENVTRQTIDAIKSSKTIEEVAGKLGITYQGVMYRITHSAPIEDAARERGMRKKPKPAPVKLKPAPAPAPIPTPAEDTGIATTAEVRAKEKADIEAPGDMPAITITGPGKIPFIPPTSSGIPAFCRWRRKEPGQTFYCSLTQRQKGAS